MKKFKLIILVLLLTGCSKVEKINPLKELGYSEEEINIIQTLKEENIASLETKNYNANYITLIENENFDENYLEDYIEFMNEKALSIDDTIYIVNNHYNDLNITYDDVTLLFMKSKYYIHNNLNTYLEYEKNLNHKFSTEQDKIDYTITAVNSNVNYTFYTNEVPSDVSKGYLMIVNKYHYLSSDYVPDNLVTIDSKYGKTLELEKTTYEAFIQMYNDASKDGVNLYIFSPYRSYNTQYSLYNRYVSRDGKTLADTYSARAGYSEHQTGLAIDISRRGGNLNGFESTKEFQWLKENSYKYGFIIRYPKGKEWITGYQYEPWHYRYVGVDVATKIYKENITFEEYYAYYIENK